MASSSDLYIFIAALVAVYLLPGPDMALILSTSAFGGRYNGLMVAVGLAMSRALHVTLAALGLAALFIAHPLLFDAVRWVGAAYLCWLAWRLLRTPKANSTTLLAHHQIGIRALRQGFLTNLLNPKALMFCALLLPQFITPTGNLFEQYLLFGTILVTVGAIFDVFYVLASSEIAHHFSGSHTGQKIARVLFATAFGIAAIRLAVSAR